MKKLFLFIAFAAMGVLAGCSYDDSAILNKIDEMEKEQNEMQEQLDAQQTLLDALANNLTITAVTQTDNGYTITFSDGTSMTINDGEKGDKGDKGDKGEQGDSFIESIVVGEENVTFTLADGTVIVIPLGSGGSSDGGEPSAENNKIYYTTSDGKKLFPYTTEPAAFGAILVSNTYEEGQGVLTFDDSITSIGSNAFYFCTSLISITIPDSVTTIGEYAFCSCNSLESITIPDSVTTIGYAAFAYCTSLTSVTIPDGVTEIGSAAFSACTSLTSVTIGDSVTSIGQEAFSSCTSLTSVYCKPTTPPSLGEDAFKWYDSSWNSVNIGCALYVPTASVEAYKSATYWSDYASDIVGYEF
ncbi:MAG: leucine-rich repeat protein [Alistipes sp.]|nr:leucine-rich repeat protein [Alistipes sp.]